MVDSQHLLEYSSIPELPEPRQAQILIKPPDASEMNTVTERSSPADTGPEASSSLRCACLASLAAFSSFRSSLFPFPCCFLRFFCTCKSGVSIAVEPSGSITLSLSLRFLLFSLSSMIRSGIVTGRAERSTAFLSHLAFSSPGATFFLLFLSFLVDPNRGLTVSSRVLLDSWISGA